MVNEILTIEQIQQLTSDELLAVGTQQRIFSLANEFVEFLEYADGARMAKHLMKLIEGHHSTDQRLELEALYHGTIVKLKFLALNFFKLSDIKSLFQNELVTALQDERLNIIDRLEAFLIEYDVEERDPMKEQLLNVIYKSQESFAPAKGLEGVGTIELWVKNYIGETSPGTATALSREEYFMRAKSVQRLTEIEKEQLRKLVSLIEFLKLSSLTPEGFEEEVIFVDDDGTLKSLSKGIVYSLDASTIETRTPIATEVLEPVVSSDPESIISSIADHGKNEVLKAYQGDKKTVQAITKEQQKLETKFGTDTARLRAEFFAAVQKKNVIRTIALVRLLAQQGDLGTFMQSDEKLHPFLRAIWEKRYGTEVAQQFDQTADTPEFLKLFLRYILEERLEMGESDAARVGLQIGNIFVSNGKKSYNKMVYFDVSSKTFHWFE